MPICPTDKCGLLFGKCTIVFRELVEVRRKIGVLLCRADHLGSISHNDLRNRKRLTTRLGTP
jgi:hypothetical protein